MNQMDGWLYAAVALALVFCTAVPLGAWLARVLEGELPGPGGVFRTLENLILCGIGARSADQMDWKRYALALMNFQLIGFLVVYGIQRAQAVMPMNAARLPGVAPHSAFNVAISFVTNTNWQNYGGETTMSHLTQMLALTVQNFVSAATGLAVLAAVARGIRARESPVLGNFWADLVRCTVSFLLPLSLVFALVLAQQGVPQTFRATSDITTLEGATQAIPVGPVASQVSIKQLGTNGGGYYNVNSAHPLENPTPVTNLLQLVAILLIPAACCHAYGRMLRDRRQGWMLTAAMSAVLVAGIAIALAGELRGNPLLDSLGIAGPNLEGKELRNGVASSAVWSVFTTAASNGSVNSMHDSFTPSGGLVQLLMMQLGEVIFGGVGCGLYGMLMFVLVAVFIAGLMVGRTPEYLGKKIGPFEMKMASLALLAPNALILLATAAASLSPEALASRSNPGAHGFSQILYAFTSQAANNGSAFGGYSANIPFVNVLGAVCMWLARYLPIVFALAIAGSLARKKYTPAGAGTLQSHTPLFTILLIGVVVLLGALSFVPALMLGPITEQLQLFSR